MLRRNYSLILMAVWLAVAVALFAPGWVLPAKAARLVGGAGPMVGLLALAFAAYNLARWWAYRTLRARRREVNPLARRLGTHRPQSVGLGEELFDRGETDDLREDPPRA